MIYFFTYRLISRETGRLTGYIDDIEAQLTHERNLLERKVKERTVELEQAQAHKTMELYRFAEFGRFSSSFLHDLANPLTAASLHFSALETRQEPELTMPVRDSITHMEEYILSARRQLRSEGDERVFDARTEITKVCEMMTAKAKLHNIVLDITLSRGLTIYGDVTKFHQILGNLISNAVDSYSTSMSTTEKAVYIHAQSDNTNRWVFVGVADAGRGISEQQLGRIFDPFYTTKSQDRGMGIGMTIVRRMVEDDFGGQIHVFSKLNEGTTVVMRLPDNATKSQKHEPVRS